MFPADKRETRLQHKFGSVWEFGGNSTARIKTQDMFILLAALSLSMINVTSACK